MLIIGSAMTSSRSSFSGSIASKIRPKSNELQPNFLVWISKFQNRDPVSVPITFDRQDNPDGRSNVRSLEATWGLLDPTARFGKFSKSNSTNPTLKRSKINGRLTGRLSSPATPNRFAWSYAQGTLNSQKDSLRKKIAKSIRRKWNTKRPHRRVMNWTQTYSR